MISMREAGLLANKQYRHKGLRQFWFAYAVLPAILVLAALICFAVVSNGI